MQTDQTTQPIPKPAPTHIALPLRMRDAMVQQLSQFPFGQVEEIVNALRQAPQLAIQPTAIAKSNGQQSVPVKAAKATRKKLRKR